MKFLVLLSAALAVASSTMNTVSAEIESVNGITLPARSRHPLSEQRRSAMMEEFYRQNPNEKRTSSHHSRRGSRKACKAKTSKAQQSSNPPKNQNTDKPKVSSSHKNPTSSSSSSSSSNQSSGKTTEGKSDSSSSSSSTSISIGKGLFGLTSNNCGSSGATESLPNGQQWFLNCGIDQGGWKPPTVKLDQLKIADPDEAVKGAFKPCKDLVWAFKQASQTHNVPATVLMSFAMQESTCRPWVTGGNGEQGLMQITQDKCGGAPNGDCKDVYFNVNAGAKYFKQQLDANNGNVLLALGQYNGWYEGLTVSKATQPARQGNCHAQQNLDYLFQLLNGWFLGKEAYSMGKYQNVRC
ncbi:hypothetical protein IE53DRAFT_370029 [Violaceomyces palustris]|uniref:Uncharacterized protein n=1 Tax=Violaceomyces palustris TaxID=1673888 RepID=A0ACD0NTR1_9BASI|nr:hypothetical protein IE53DRAFT_370029 [Violaceomyces palustris]